MTDSQAAAAQVSDVPTGPRREILIVLPGLLLTLIIAMLDQLVVSTALPRIVGDLGGLNHLAWVVTAYILASTDHDARCTASSATCTAASGS